MKARILLFLYVATLCVLICKVHGDDEDDCDRDIDMSLLTYHFNYSNHLFTFHWTLKSNTDCPIEYHLIVNDAYYGVVQDVRVEEKFVELVHISPCITYQFDLGGVNKARPDKEEHLVKTYLIFLPTPQVAPVVKSIDIQATSINVTWTLEGDMNRCTLRNFYIDGGKYFNETFSLEDLKDPTTVSTEIKSLKPNSMYYFQAYVENSGGKSAATQLAVQTLVN